MTWQQAAEALADAVADKSPWRAAVAATPRHLLVPNWWEQHGEQTWALRRGPRDETAWLAAAYDDRSLITQVGDRHADRAGDDDRPPSSWPAASSSTLPSLVLRMFDVAGLEEGMRVLDLGTGSGYSSALLAHRFGDDHVTSVDVGPYLVHAARERLAAFGRRPILAAIDATSTLPGDGFDAAVAMFSTRAIPPTWLAAVRPGGIISTTLAGTSLHLRVTVVDAHHAHGEVVSRHASFMRARDDAATGGEMDTVYRSARTAEGDRITDLTSPLPDLFEDWQPSLLLELLLPGVEHRRVDLEDRSMVWLLHPDGSWARAESHTNGKTQVHTSGPTDLWPGLERARHLLTTHGPLDRTTMRLTIDPEGQRLTWPETGLSFPL